MRGLVAVLQPDRLARMKPALARRSIPGRHPSPRRRGESPRFVPGIDLNRRFHDEILAPLLRAHFPGLPYSAGLMGEGSDVLGYDNERSMDHNWGPRGVLFLSEDDEAEVGTRIKAMLSERLPTVFSGFPTHFTEPRETYLVQQMQPIERGPVNHMVRTFSVKSFFLYYLGFDPSEPITNADWLTFPQQALIEVTGGAVYHDGLGALEPAREKLRYFPDAVWMYLLYAQWYRIANELSYQARSGERGDDLGSRILAARMCEEIVKLCFLYERTYLPYSKWRGLAFQKLSAAKVLRPILDQIIADEDWRVRQRGLARAYCELGEIHNRLAITPPVSTELSDFHGRGYLVLDVGRFMEAIRAKISDPKLRSMKYPIGGIDQFINHARINHENYLHRFLTCVIQ